MTRIVLAIRVSLGVTISLILSTAASAAIKCVNPRNNACFTTIGAAVSAASEGDTIQVANGTYHEIVVIDKSYISLISTNRKNTIIDASGLSVVVDTNNIASGIYVDGIDNPGLCHAVISGFTIRGANFEGILVANAMAVTVADNFITDNDKTRLTASTCPGLPSFETNEGFDCGGGIHLIGANYSFVSSNIVENNASGILISDETAGSYSNVIEGNIVENNPFDGGITLASHPPAALTGRITPFGVTNNTIAGNVSNANGLQGGGAGVGIFDSAVGSNNSGNVVINNTLTNNGLPGIAIHSETAGQFLYSNQIVSNTISGNGADMSNGTTVSTGINVFALLPSAYSTVIVSNKISNESLDVAVNTPTNVEVHLNNLQGKGVGIENSSTGRTDATENWWGCAGGPGAKGCSTASSPTGTVASTPFANKRF